MDSQNKQKEYNFLLYILYKTSVRDWQKLKGQKERKARFLSQRCKEKKEKK